MKKKKNRPILGWISIAIAIFCLIGTMSVFVDYLESPANKDLIKTLAMAIAWTVGFGGMGIAMLVRYVKGAGWGIAAAALLGVDAVWVLTSIENDKLMKSPGTWIALILTVIFIALLVVCNLKTEKNIVNDSKE